MFDGCRHDMAVVVWADGSQYCKRVCLTPTAGEDNRFSITPQEPDDPGPGSIDRLAGGIDIPG